MPSEKKEPRYVAVEDLAADLGITELDLRAMLRKLSPIIKLDHRGREAVPATCISDLPNDAHAEAIHRALRAEAHARRETEPDTDVIREMRLKLLQQYAPLIDGLENLHRKYLKSANFAGSESAGMAVYLLLSRVIATLKMANDCLRIGHWYSGSLLREVDECLDLADYFAITKGTVAGLTTLKRWFRENISPSHATCRKAISDWHDSQKGQEAVGHLELLQELYRKKSKWIHPTYLTIREVASFDAADHIALVSVDYGPCSYEQKLLELTVFFRSSIWSTFQCLGISFQLVLDMAPDDVALVCYYDSQLQKLTDGA